MFGIDDAIMAIGSASASAGAQLGSTWLSNWQTHKYAKDANDLSIELANSSHQREVADLEAAGLNPILSASGNGASVPQLKAADAKSLIDSSSAESIRRAISGEAAADLKSAKADAASAQAYADRSKELAAAEVSAKQAENRIAHNQAEVSDTTKEADRIDALARLEALQGHRPPEVDDRVGRYYGNKKVGMDTYEDLVQQYRNEIASGRYKSSLTNAAVKDVIDGASSAAQVYGAVRGGKLESFNKNYKRVETEGVNGNGVKWRQSYYERKKGKQK